MDVKFRYRGKEQVITSGWEHIPNVGDEFAFNVTEDGIRPNNLNNRKVLVVSRVLCVPYVERTMLTQWKHVDYIVELVDKKNKITEDFTI